MKKTVFIVTLTACVLIGVWGAVLFLGTSTTSVTAPVTQEDVGTSTERTPVPQPFTGFGTLASLAERNQTIECAITYEPSTLEPAIEGTYFIHGQKIRGDFLIRTPDSGEQILTSVITNRDMQFIWSDINGELFDTKVTNSQTETVAAQLPVPVDARVQYNCRPWPVVDGSIFEPPARVEFRDYANQIQAGMEDGIQP